MRYLLCLLVLTCCHAFGQTSYHHLTRFDSLKSSASTRAISYGFNFLYDDKSHTTTGGETTNLFLNPGAGITLTEYLNFKSIQIKDRFGKDSITYSFKDSVLTKTTFYLRDDQGRTILIKDVKYNKEDTTVLLNLYYYQPLYVSLGSQQLHTFHQDMIDLQSRFFIRYSLYDSLFKTHMDIVLNEKGDTLSEEVYEHFDGYYLKRKEIKRDFDCPEYFFEADYYESPCYNKMVKDFRKYSLTSKEGFVNVILKEYRTLLNQCDCSSGKAILISADKKIRVAISFTYNENTMGFVSHPSKKDGNWEGLITVYVEN